MGRDAQYWSMEANATHRDVARQVAIIARIVGFQQTQALRISPECALRVRLVFVNTTLRLPSRYISTQSRSTRDIARRIEIVRDRLKRTAQS